jgi:hypothetical protein
MNSKQRTAAAEKLTDLRGKLLDAIQAYNDATEDMDDLVTTLLTDHLEEYLETIRTTADALAEAVSDVEMTLDTYIDDKSEKWQESEVGEALIAVRDVCQNFDLSELANMDSVDFHLTISDIDTSDVNEVDEAIDQLENA